MVWKKIVNEKRLRDSKEKIKEYDQRTPFDNDYGRVIFTPAVRRMHDKTQVFPLTRDDNIHSRLTHSLEAQAVARNMGLNVCRVMKDDILAPDIKKNIPSILATVALCHDIGNPPFGHYGEESIQNFFKAYFAERDKRDKKVKKEKRLQLTKFQRQDFLKFDGNPQGFRVLTKLEFLYDEFGLNLALGTLSAFLKYPFTAEEIGKGYNFSDKIGVFQSEKEILKEIRVETGLDKVRNPLTFLMEAADNICYNVIDLEDGINSKYVTLDDFFTYLDVKNDEYVNEFLKVFNTKYNKDKYDEDGRVGGLRISLMGELINQACKEYVDNFESICKGKYKTELLKGNKLLKFIKEFDYSKIYTNKKIELLELTGERIIGALLRHFVEAFVDEGGNGKRSKKLFNLISKRLRKLLEFELKKDKLTDLSDYEKLRLIVDYISGMTDSYALDLYRKLEGITI